MRTLATLAALSLLVAGCADSSSGDPDTQGADLDFGVATTATTGVIRGVVFDEAIRPLGNATVALLDPSRNTTTDEDGAFGFQNLEPGTYFLVVSKPQFTSVQQSVDVEAGVDEPPIVKVMLAANPTAAPYVDAFSYRAYITCGAAIVATSVGCNTFPDVGRALGDRVYFPFLFTTLPNWTQGELVWDHTQAAGGAMIWEIVNPDQPAPQRHTGYRETAASPALAYINRTLLEDSRDWVLDPEAGLMYRIFAGPHPTCTGVGFGCGLTLQQQLDVYVHNFFNAVPAEGWRFTLDGEPRLQPV